MTSAVTKTDKLQAILRLLRVKILRVMIYTPSKQTNAAKIKIKIIFNIMPPYFLYPNKFRSV
nr:MAG TPA: hypothetical protein [Caudoviricetes sp.]